VQRKNEKGIKMEIKINHIHINENQFDAVIQVKGLLHGDRYNSYDFTKLVERVVAERLVDEFLLANTEKILNSVNVQAVVNALTLNIADKIKGRN
jgi:hypothetical protein